MTDLQEYLRLTGSAATHEGVPHPSGCAAARRFYLVQDPLHTLDAVDALEFRLGHLVDVPVPARRRQRKEAANVNLLGRI